MIIAADTSPLVALSGIRRLGLLRTIFGEVVIPPAVYREIIDQGVGWLEAEEVQAAILAGELVKVWSKPFGLLSAPARKLDAGEVEAISLAKHMNSLCLLDERRGRAFAEANGVRVIGSLGVIIRAKNRGLVTKVAPLIEAMRANGINLADSLISAVLSECDE
jgi:uncharacterized protein